MNAIDAKSAKARATIAARLLLSAKTWGEGGHGLGRNFDDCFEMGDGHEVHRLLILRAAQDERLVAAMLKHGCKDWVEQVRQVHQAVLL